jgi:hypothetical protein
MAIGAAAGRRGQAWHCVRTGGRLVSARLTRPGNLRNPAGPLPVTLLLVYWSVGNDRISRGVSPGDFTVLIAVGLCALAASVAALRNADLN